MNRPLYQTIANISCVIASGPVYLLWLWSHTHCKGSRWWCVFSKWEIWRFQNILAKAYHLSTMWRHHSFFTLKLFLFQYKIVTLPISIHLFQIRRETNFYNNIRDLVSSVYPAKSSDCIMIKADSKQRLALYVCRGCWKVLVLAQTPSFWELDSYEYHRCIIMYINLIGCYANSGGYKIVFIKAAAHTSLFIMIMNIQIFIHKLRCSITSLLLWDKFKFEYV